MDSNDAIRKLKAFIEIAGKELPTKEQWDKIVGIIEEAGSFRYTKPEDLLIGREDIDRIFKPTEPKPYYDQFYPSRDWMCGPQIISYQGQPLDNSFDIKDILSIDPPTQDVVGSKISETNSVSFRFEADEGDDDDRTNPGRHG